jgi:hypothetical protein
MTIVIVNLSLRSDINKYNTTTTTTRHRRDIVREAEADTFGHAASISIGLIV